MSKDWRRILVKLDEYRYMIPRTYKPGMQTDVIIFVDEALLETVTKDLSLEQAANLAFLPGVVGRPIVLPDVHQGYGFPIGGVAATDAEEGVVSPAGIGFDINCGVRLLRSELTLEQVRPKLENIVNDLFHAVPAGTGREGQISVNRAEMDNVLRLGAQWAVEQGYGREEDLDHIESRGCIPGANPKAVSEYARQRGADQLGTLGSGNHFLEIQYVEEVFDRAAAQAFGLRPGQVTVLIHTGSRGFGHQVCTDYLKVLRSAMQKYKIHLPDKEMAATYIKSPEGQDYLGAMNAAANFAFANRQMITHWVREVFRKHFGDDGELQIVYDVAHNIAKFETHAIEGKPRRVLVHRKGATRALPAGHPELHETYRTIGQPVIIPGDMGRASYVLIGTAAEETFASSCHGAGRVMSRTAAKKGRDINQVRRQLAERGVLIKAASKDGVLEEVPEAYKDVNDVARVVEAAGIARRVARLRPIGVVKG
ncbi:MAG: RtcB family protein [Blastocatellia bacterium]|nr:RtcB family protein [Blastocatellia bacterium]MCS7157045.1 RtcB family protein [Blastocatellia bacterium]MDW8167738.1 RtcB family protein [Acidobacteriota bacterium]